MDRAMRRLLTFTCQGDALGASLDSSGGETGILFVTGGTQTRVGSHRMNERLAGELAAMGYPAFRFDRRGVGDSEGEDPGFRGSAGDIAAAAAAFRAECPDLERVIGFGLCDGATALALFSEEARLDGLIMANPWLVETEGDEPAPAAIRSRYRERLQTTQGWKNLLTGAVSYKKLLKGVLKAVAPGPAGRLSDRVAAALHGASVKAEIILASGDATAIAAEHELRCSKFNDLQKNIQNVPTDSHSFARPGDADKLLAACLEAIRRLGG
jgi:exosortase A-associated hydrolase 1